MGSPLQARSSNDDTRASQPTVNSGIEEEPPPLPRAHEVPPPFRLRAAAWSIDLLIVLLAALWVPQPFAPVVPLGLLIAYHTVLTWLVQQTVGKALLGLRVKRLDGRPTLLWALGRSSVGYLGVDLLGLGVIFGLAATHRPLHDVVFGSVVILEDSGPITLRTLVDRLVRVAECQRAAIDQRKKSFAVLAGLWGSLVGFGDRLRKILDWLGRSGKSTSKPSIAQVITTKMATTIAVATTAVTIALVTYVPPAGAAIKWLFSPRQFLTAPEEQLVDVGGVLVNTRAFADQVVDARISPEVSEGRRDPHDALGPPDCNDASRCTNETDVSLGTATEKCQYFITLRFVDNKVFNGPGEDLRVVEIGAVEPTDVFVQYHGRFVEVGQIEGGDEAIDLSPAIPPKAEISNVKLCDAVDRDTSGSPGADVDAVAALNSRQ